MYQHLFFSSFFSLAVTVIVLLLESTVVILVLAKDALTGLNTKIQFLRQEDKLNCVTHLHLLPRLYSASLSFQQIIGY